VIATTHAELGRDPGARRQAGRRARAARAVTCVRGPLVAGLVLALSLAARAQPLDPGAAVFQVINVETATSRPGIAGSAFFVAPDGTALTNSHVVYPSAQHPDRYQLLALVGQEFYSASVVCASALPYDPTQPPPLTGVPLGRDVAEIKLGPSTFRFTTWGYRFPGGEFLTAGTAHRGALPVFAALTVRGGPTPGGHVRVTGFGHLSPIASEWTAVGEALQPRLAPDGTTLFEVQFQGAPQPGNSGSPVLNDANVVIGIWTWYYRTRPDTGLAQSASALQPACR